MPKVRLLFCLSKRKPCEAGEENLFRQNYHNSAYAPGRGTLKGVLELAKIKEEEFWKKA